MQENLGLKTYEYINHLGNVLLTTNDKRLPIDNNADNIIDAYSADMRSYSDYYPYGMAMVGRNADIDAYGFGFNDKPYDSEFHNSQTTYNYGRRLLDTRLGRFFSVDPLSKQFPMYSPYHFSGNKPTSCIDLEGLEDVYFMRGFVQEKGGGSAVMELIYSTELAAQFMDDYITSTTANAGWDIYITMASSAPIPINKRGMCQFVPLTDLTNLDFYGKTIENGRGAVIVTLYPRRETGEKLSEAQLTAYAGNWNLSEYFAKVVLHELVLHVQWKLHNSPEFQPTGFGNGYEHKLGGSTTKEDFDKVRSMIINGAKSEDIQKYLNEQKNPLYDYAANREEMIAASYFGDLFRMTTEEAINKTTNSRAPNILPMPINHMGKGSGEWRAPSKLNSRNQSMNIDVNVSGKRRVGRAKRVKNGKIKR